MNRTQQILAAVLALQVLLTAGIYWQRTPAQTPTAALITDLKAADVTSITITDTGGDKITLAKKDGKWVLPDAGDFAADSEKIQPVLEKLVAIQTNRLVTRTSASHQRLEVAEDNFQRKVQITLASGKTYTLIIGSSPSAGATHVRLADQDIVYLTGELTTYDLQAQTSNWIDAALFTVASADITEMSLKNDTGMYTLKKGSDDNWSVEGVEPLAAGEQLNQENLKSLVSGLASLRIAEPLGKEDKSEYGLNSPAAIVIFTTKNTAGEKKHELKIGAVEGSNYYVSTSDSPYYVKVPSNLVEKLVSDSRSDFVTSPATATPAPATTPTP